MATARFAGAVLWDLDGTLLKTAQAGRIALQDAVRELTGRPADYSDLPIPGLTDAEVADVALRAVGVEPDASLLLRLQLEYERRLPAALLLRDGAVLPGVRQALDGLAKRGRVVSLLLTGNTPAGARAKLERYGLADCFPYGGGYCEGPGGRVPIARRALEVAQTLIHAFSSERALVIGDTPRDVECAHELGLRSLAIASGTYSSGELHAAGAWLVRDRVPKAATLEQLALGEFEPAVLD